jgi:hypothetical protein
MVPYVAVNLILFMFDLKLPFVSLTGVPRKLFEGEVIFVCLMA